MPRTIDRIKYINNSVRRALDALSTSRLSGPQRFIIMHLGNLKPGESYCEKDISRQLNLSKSTVSGLLAAMERQGLIVRETGKRDSRFKTVCLTPAGRLLHQEAEEGLSALDARLTRDLLPSERTALNSLLDKIIATIESDHRHQ